MITEARIAEVAVVPALMNALTKSSLSPLCSGTRSVMNRSATKRVRPIPIPVASRVSKRCCVWSSIKPPSPRLVWLPLFLRTAETKQPWVVDPGSFGAPALFASKVPYLSGFRNINHAEPLLNTLFPYLFYPQVKVNASSMPSVLTFGHLHPGPLPLCDRGRAMIAPVLCPRLSRGAPAWGDFPIHRDSERPSSRKLCGDKKRGPGCRCPSPSLIFL